MIKQALLCLVFLLSNKVLAMDLKDFLVQVKSQHHGLQALELAKAASDERRQAGDISLVPVLQIKGQYTKDEKVPNFLGASNSQSTVYGLGLSQKFSTGTNLSLTANTGSYLNPDIASPTVAANYGSYVSGSLNFQISQSLWKDAFGHATRLRREREQVTSQAEKASADAQWRSLLVDAEKSYWDYVYLLEELKLRKASLERAQKILTWVSKRTSDGIGDKSDLLNAKALLATRKLQLQMSDDDIKAAGQKIRDSLEMSSQDSLPQIQGSIHQARHSKYYVDGRGRTVSYDAYLKYLNSKIKGIAADETADAVKSDLVLSGGYASNPYKTGTEIDYAVNNLAVFNKPTATVALTWTYMFDTQVKNSQQSQARKEALSSQMQSDHAMIEGQSQWKEYLRRYDELSRRILTAAEISTLQMERAKSEQSKLSRGRSITQNVILAEQDAAESELNLTKLKAEQRKLEAQGRLFIVIEDKI